MEQLIQPEEMRGYIDAFHETMLEASGGVEWSKAPTRQ
jgi:hypothetical protein